MKHHQITFLIALSCLIILTSCQNFQSICNGNEQCSSEKFLKCINNQCECENPENQIFDPIEGECVILSGSNCLQSNLIRVPQCVQGGECNPRTLKCECSKGFYETSFNICSYTIGKSCIATTDCEISSRLECQNGVCKCPDSSYIWQLELGCATAYEISAAFSNNETNTTASIDSTTFTSFNPIDNNYLIPDIEHSNLTETDDITNFTKVETDGLGDTSSNINSNNSNETIDDRDGFLQTIAQNSPIIKLLFPNRKQLSESKLNDNNFVPQQNNNQIQQQPQNINQQSQQLQNINQQQQQPQNINQNFQNTNQQVQQSQNQHFQLFPNYQSPSNLVPNFLNPLPLQNTVYNKPPQRQRLFDFPMLRRLLTPLKQYLFPGIRIDPDSRGMDLPSPIWLFVSAVNQILPILRAIDHQISPVLHNIALLTRPQYLNNLNTNTNNNFNNGPYPYQQNYINNNNLNQQQQTQQQQIQQQTQQPQRQSRYNRYWNK